MFTSVRALLGREFRLAVRRKTDVLMVLSFFLIITSLFPISGQFSHELLRAIAPSVIWVAALLASLLSLDRLFELDYEDGSLEQMLLSPQPLTALVTAKILSHWLISLLPLILVTPLIGMQYQLNMAEVTMMVLSLLLGTPAFSLLGAMGASLTLGLRGGGVLVALLILPLCVPVLIYGTGVMANTIANLGSSAAFLWMLGGISLLTAALSPVLTALGLKVSVQ